MSKYLKSKAIPTRPGVRVVRVKVGESLPESSQSLDFHQKQALVYVSRGRPERSLASIMDTKQIAVREG